MFALTEKEKELLEIIREKICELHAPDYLAQISISQDNLNAIENESKLGIVRIELKPPEILNTFWGAENDLIIHVLRPWEERFKRGIKIDESAEFQAAATFGKAAADLLLHPHSSRLLAKQLDITESEFKNLLWRMSAIGAGFQNVLAIKNDVPKERKTNKGAPSKTYRAALGFEIWNVLERHGCDCSKVNPDHLWSIVLDRFTHYLRPGDEAASRRYEKDHKEASLMFKR